MLPEVICDTLSTPSTAKQLHLTDESRPTKTPPALKRKKKNLKYKKKGKENQSVGKKI